MLRLCLEWWQHLPECRRQSLKRRFYATLLSLILAALLNLGYSENYAKEVAKNQADHQLLFQRLRFPPEEEEISERSILMQFRMPQLTKRPPASLDQALGIKALDDTKPSDASHSKNRHPRSNFATTNQKTSFRKSFLDEERRSSIQRIRSWQWSSVDNGTGASSPADGTAWNCAGHFPTSAGTDQEKCENGNTLNDGLEYLFNTGATMTTPGACGIAGCSCCLRAKVHLQACASLTLNPDVASRTYSSVYTDATGVAHDNSTLDSSNAWSANAGAEQKAGDSWMTMDVGRKTQITGVVTRARADKEWEYVKNFTVQYSSDASAWEDVPGVFTGSSTSESSIATFPSTVEARYVKVVVQSFSIWISLRAGVVVCKEDYEKIDDGSEGNGGANLTVSNATNSSNDNSTAATTNATNSSTDNSSNQTLPPLTNVTETNGTNGTATENVTNMTSTNETNMTSTNETNGTFAGNVSTNETNATFTDNSSNVTAAANETNATNVSNETTFNETDMNGTNLTNATLTNETLTNETSGNVTNITSGNVSNETEAANGTVSNETNATGNASTNGTDVSPANQTNATNETSSANESQNGTSTNATNGTPSGTPAPAPSSTVVAAVPNTTTTTNALPFVNEDAVPKKSLIQQLVASILGDGN
mmetsp:Transcript_163469/g.313944  ORF Transcript_163469/g.313944 Transcript_163469/m.313944 type:complete len:652 (-) Transcript_163469:144-2099(-)